MSRQYACVEAIYCKVARLGLSLVIVVVTVVLKNAHTFTDLRLVCVVFRAARKPPDITQCMCRRRII